MRRILMVYDRFPPFNTSGSARPFRFAKNLPSAGYLPLVVASQPNPSDPQDHELLAELPREVEVMRGPPLVRPTIDPWMKALAQRKRRRLAAKKASPSPGMHAAGEQPPARGSEQDRFRTRVSGYILWSLDWYADWGAQALRLAMQAARRHRFELVWASAPHSKNAFAGYLVSKRLGIPLVLDLRDPWTYGSNWRPRLPATGRVENWWAKKIIRHASRVVFTSPLTERAMLERFPAARTCTITNGFDPRPVAALRDIVPEKCLFRYVGILNDRRIPDPLLEGFRLAAQDPELAREVHLEFVGGMAGHEAKIEKYQVEHLVSFRGHVAKKEAEGLIRGSDVNVLLQTISEGQDVIAGKVFDYLAAEKPILAVVARGGGDAWLLDSCGTGKVVGSEDPRAVAAAVRQLWQDWRSGGVPQNQVDLQRFSNPTLTRQLATVFDEVLAVRRG